MLDEHNLCDHDFGQNAACQWCFELVLHFSQDLSTLKAACVLQQGCSILAVALRVWLQAPLLQLLLLQLLVEQPLQLLPLLQLVTTV